MDKRWILLSILGFLFAVSIALVASQGLPGGIELNLFDDDYNEGDAIDGEFIINFTQPINPDTLVEAGIGNFFARRALTDIFDEEGITYAFSSGTFTAVNPSNSITMTFPQAGGQYVFFQLNKDVTVNLIDMNIHGTQNGNSYPSFTTMDVGLDGDLEWSYTRGLNGYGQFVLPNDLHENENGGNAALTDKESYYCEVIDLPRAKDFRVSAKNRFLMTGGNLSAVILSINSGATMQGAGGADKCSLPDGGASFVYTNCDVHLQYFIEGERLVCVYNDYATPNGGTTKHYHELQMDNGVQSDVDAYVCGAIGGNGVTNCVQNDKDFYIKVNAGNYSGELKQQVPFDDGLTEFDFVDALNNYLQGCSSPQCIIPLRITSASAGVLYLDNLQLEYGTSAGGSFTYTQFYEGSSSGGYLYKINNIDLTQGNALITLPLDVLNVVAPNVNATSNMTLKLRLNPGPAANSTFIVRNTAVQQQQNLGEVIKAYKAVLNNVAQAKPELLKMLGYKDDVDKGIIDLNSYLAQYLALNGSTQSQQTKDAIIANITNKTDTLMEHMPKSLVVSKSVTDYVVPGANDISDQVVLANQRTQEIRDKLYIYQGQITVLGTADYYVIEFFDGSEKRGTMITKKVTGGSGYAVEILPGLSASAVTFDDNPETLQASGPAIARWAKGAGDATYQYVLQGDKVSILKDLKTLVIPQIVPELTKSITPQVSYNCGDGVCAVLETDSGEIPLEDSITCPQDCKRKYPMTTWLVSLLAIIAIIWYLNFYHGKYSWDDLNNKLKIGSKKPASSATSWGNFFTPKEKVERKLFISQADERNVIGYIENALRKGFNKSKVSDALLNKGWTREQIEYAFGKAKK